MTITMNWYYVQSGAQAGPVDDAQLDELVRTGIMAPDGLIWREGMANWEPYKVARGVAPPAFPSLAGDGLAPVAVAGTKACAQCGLFFPEQEVVALAGISVCANCKPIALQRMREGSWITGSRRYAGFWIRFVAYIIDYVILFAASYAIALPLGFGMAMNQAPDPDNPTAYLGFAGIVALLTYVARLVYFAAFESKMGGSPGKLLLGLRVIRSDGSTISVGRAVGRWFAWALSSMILAIGHIMAGFDAEKRSLHDHICDTRVIYKS